DQIIEIVFRYKWLIICLLAVVLTIGLVKTLTASRIYRATTMILIQPQEVPSNYVRPVVTTGIEERLSTISQEILSRTNLEKIINQFDLYKNKDNMYLEDKIDNLRNRISIIITRARARQGSETFTIKFEGDQPDQVMQVTNTLASFFMDENLRTREAQVVGTSEFLDEELDKIKETLELKEEDLAEYRLSHAGGLPSELESNLRTLDRLQSQLTDNQAALREARNTAITTQHQIIRQRELSLQTPVPALNSSGGETVAPIRLTDRNELKRLKGDLSNLLLKYTEKHPDVVKLQTTIKKLTKKIGNKDETEVSEVEEILSTDPEVRELEMQLKQVENTIAALVADIRTTKGRMELHEKWVELTPKREQELQKLLRDYATIQNSYTSLLDRRLEAELSVNMEKKQKGEQFRVLDYAIRPEKPISPNVIKMGIISLGAGCALAGGIVYFFFIFDNAIRSKEDIENIFKLPILVEIGSIKKSGDMFKEKISALFLVLASSYVVAIMGVFLMLELYGIERASDLIESYMNF
ncbi:MAG: protein GumC, partial [Desulfobacteraceae bacterium]|nr:protein GumC [Desulfobacteraceae bacterium]